MIIKIHTWPRISIGEMNTKARLQKVRTTKRKNQDDKDKEIVGNGSKRSST